ncbi:MAG TPA: amino acid adenylation domain-containing protein, partial [Jatrophihabitans sp.]|nr:amino acid adenylation domain-containing protein [Jatrophihabitans sp.]
MSADPHLLPDHATPAADTARSGRIEPVPDRTGRLPLSFAQQRLWFLTQLAGASEAYHMPQALELTGELDRAALGRALDALVARHEALRTRFGSDGGEGYCLIDPPEVGFALRVEDLTDRPETVPQVQQYEAGEPFDLSTGPLARGRLLVLARDKHVLLLTLHHIISDGWSMGLFTAELGALYATFHNGADDPLPPLRIQYADYAAWQRTELAEGRLAEQGEYWRRALAGAPALLELPTDRPRPPVPDHHAKEFRLRFDAELTAGLKALAEQHGCTLFMVVLAAWALVLSRLSGQADVVIGTPTANRRRSELERLIGFFVNTLPIRVDLSGRPSAAQLVERTRDAALAALDHQDLPFEQVVELVNPPRSLAHTPLLQVMFTWANSEEGELALPGLQVSPIRTSYTAAKFDLTLSLTEVDGRISGGLDYATALFDRATAERHGRYLHQVLRQLVDDPDRPVAAVSLIDDTERQQLLAAAEPVASHPVEHTIDELVRQQTVRTPDAVAVVCDGQELSYRELDEQANRLAHLLIGRGVGPDRLVGVCLDRSLDLVVGLLAALKAGGGYLPLDPSSPPDRLAYLISDAEPVLVLSHASTRALVESALPEDGPPVLELGSVPEDLPADQPPVSGSPSNLAYVIYTSGSTGRPKGVLVEHANVLRLFAATERWFGFGPDDVWTLFHSAAFDFSVWEIWGALCHGGRLVVVPQLTSRSPAEFYQLLCQQGVTVLNQTPSAFRGLIAAQASVAEEHCLRTVIFGGEALDPAMLAPWYADPRNAGTELVNMYGITETTVHVTYRPLSPSEASSTGPSPIGRPIDDLRLYLLDSWGEPVPAGVVGELYVGGAGVARGYLNRPELTAQRFTDSPFVPGDRLYQTGDLARQRADGSLEYLGRNDFQVKLRGFRIELGEIEARLSACSGVRDAVVLARPDGSGEPRLVGYYIASAGTETTPAELRGALTAVLPEHMVPASYVRVPSWPLTGNGKLDRAALPEPDDRALDSQGYVAPDGPIEQALAVIWSEVLGVDRVGRFDHFFALGGHSLLALRVLDRMRQQGLPADVRALFATPTLAALAAAVGSGPAELDVPPNLIQPGCQRITPELLPLVELDQAEIDSIVATVPGGAPNVADIHPLAPVQDGILFHHLMSQQADPYLVFSVLRFDDRTRLDDYRRALDAVIARHDVLRTALVWQGLRQPVQVVWRDAPLPVHEVELDPAGPPAVEQLRSVFRTRYCRMPLDQAPLLWLVVALDPRDGHWYGLELIHHVIDDNTSLKQVGSELRAVLAGRADELPAPLPFRDFIAGTLRGPGQDEHLAYFAEQLADIDTPTAPFGLLDVHGDGVASRPARRRLDPVLSGRLRAQAQRLGVSAAAVFHTGWGQLLARTCDRPDVVFGTVLFGRMAGGDRVLGPFINTLPIRLRLAEVGVADCVRNTQAALTGLIQHEHAPLALAQRASAVPAPAPLFSTLLNYRHTAQASSAFDETADLGLIYLAADERSNYPLTLDVDDHGSDFALTVVTTGDVAPERVLGLLEQAMIGLADALEHAPDAPIERLDVLPPAERSRLLDLAGPPPVKPTEQLLHRLFEAQVRRDPDAIALVAGCELSYRELNERANRLAHHLCSQGVGPDRLVGLCFERSVEMVVGLLAVLKAGGAYLPLDPAYPAARLAAMLSDAAPVLVLAHPPARSALPSDLKLIDLVDDTSAWAGQPVTDPVVAELTPDRLAYVIYTSGTTGTANGVQVEHRQLAGIAAGWQQLLDLRPGLTHLQLASLSFDVCTADVIRSLGFGGRLVLCPRELLADSAGLFAFIQQHQVNFADFVPAVLVPLLGHLESTGGDLAGFETLICGSEAWTPAAADRLRALCGPSVRIVNAYGLTEAAVDST